MNTIFPYVKSQLVRLSVDLVGGGVTKTSNGTFQIPPIHHEWNEDKKMVPSSYEPVQPRPDWYQALEKGIPGLHYPIEDDS